MYEFLECKGIAIMNTKQTDIVYIYIYKVE